MSRVEQEVEVEFGEVIAAIRRDKVMKVILTHLAIAAWLADLFPWFPHAATHIGILTNLLWIWGG